MKETFVRLDLIKNEKDFKFWFELGLLLFTFLGLVTFLFFIDNKFWKNTFLFSFLIVLFYSIIYGNKKIGSILLTENKIVVNHNREEIFLIDEISKIKLNYNGAEGTFNLGSKNLVANNGTNNLIEIFTENKKLKYRIKIRINQVKVLKNITLVWIQKLKDFELNGSFEKF